MNALMHQVAFDAASTGLGIFCGVLMDHEKRDAFWEIYEVIRQAILTYEAKRDRREQRLHPCEENHGAAHS